NSNHHRDRGAEWAHVGRLDPRRARLRMAGARYTPNECDRGKGLPSYPRNCLVHCFALCLDQLADGSVLRPAGSEDSVRIGEREITIAQLDVGTRRMPFFMRLRRWSVQYGAGFLGAVIL